MNEQTNDFKSEHISVMLNEVMEYLQPQIGDICVDGTLGLAGHSQEILKRVGPTGRLIGFDRDTHALSKAQARLKDYFQQCDFIHDDYRNMDERLEDLEVGQVNRILLDLGVSSIQLDNADRGFSIRVQGPLDMRMDQSAPISAFDLVNSLAENEIDHILRVYGEERYHRRIAYSIISERTRMPIKTTRDLRHIVLKSIPHRNRHEKIHPATRTFQAFRIAVNRELEALEVALDKCIPLLAKGGRIAIISFHSLEDRIVKHKFRQFAKDQMVELITKKPLRPTDEECQINSRARSARLRIVERL